MGAWGAGAFENDDALGLVEEGVSFETIEVALRAALRRGYLDVDDGSRGVAELVCALNGYPAKGLPGSARKQLEGLANASAKLVGLAKRAVARVQTQKTSELASLWEGNVRWAGLMDDLAARLGRRPKRNKASVVRKLMGPPMRRQKAPGLPEVVYVGSPGGRYVAYVTQLGRTALASVGMPGTGEDNTLYRDIAHFDEFLLEWTAAHAVTVYVPRGANDPAAPFKWDVPRTVKMPDGKGIRVTLRRGD